MLPVQEFITHRAVEGESFNGSMRDELLHGEHRWTDWRARRMSDNLRSALAAASGQLHRGVEAAAKLQGLYIEPQAQQKCKFSITQNIPEHQTQRSKASPKHHALLRTTAIKFGRSHPDR
jgi:hypothetical protein